MNRHRKLAQALFSLVSVGILAIACDAGTQDPAAPADAATSAGSTASPTDAPGPAAAAIPDSRYPDGVAPGTGKIPEEFPDAVPVYPGAVPAQSKGGDLDGVPMAAVQLMTMDPKEKVFEFYRDKLAADGWTIEDREGFQENRAIAASKGDCRASLIVIETEDGGSDIFVVTEC